MKKLFVLGKENCHLCHDMFEELRLLQNQIVFDLVWVDLDDEEFGLRYQEYLAKIPVLLDQTETVICHGRLDKLRLTHYL